MINSKYLAIAGAALASLTLAACGNGPDTASPSQIQHTPQAVSLADADIVSSGTFEGRSDHVTTGGLSLVQTGSGYHLVFADDFSLDGAPDPKIGFGADGAYAPTSQIAPLRNKTGAQTYPLPASFDPSGYSEVYIWCERFSVPLGVAKLG